MTSSKVPILRRVQLGACSVLSSSEAEWMTTPPSAPVDILTD